MKQAIDKLTITEHHDAFTGLDFARYEAHGRAAVLFRVGSRPRPPYVLTGPERWPAYAILLRETRESFGGLSVRDAEAMAVYYIHHGSLDGFDGDATGGGARGGAGA